MQRGGGWITATYVMRELKEKEARVICPDAIRLRHVVALNAQPLSESLATQPQAGLSLDQLLRGELRLVPLMGLPLLSSCFGAKLALLAAGRRAEQLPQADGVGDGPVCVADARGVADG